MSSPKSRYGSSSSMPESPHSIDGLVDLWDEVGLDAVAVGVPGGAVLALVLLVLLVDADDGEEGTHDWQVVDQQVDASGHRH